MSFIDQACQKFLREVQRRIDCEVIVGAEIERYRSNVSGRSREVPAVLLPESREDVVKIVEIANRHVTPLYPISRGRNWGLGSKLPVRDNCVIVDLQRMNQIVAVDGEFGYASVQPGVTQGQLAEHISRSNCEAFLDVTGSGTESSIIGNVLERGVAYNTLRAETVSNMEVVLGNGETIRTGFGHYQQCKTTAHLFPFGIGPSLDGLFTQSNFGIVTEATIKLIPRPHTCAAFVLSIEQPQDLPSAVDTLRHLKRQGVLSSVVHIGNRRRSTITLAPLVGASFEKPKQSSRAAREVGLTGSWTAVGNIMGARRMVAAAKSELQRALRKHGKLRFVTHRRLRMAKRVANATRQQSLRAKLDVAETLFGLNFGTPTDAPIHSLFWPLEKRWDGQTNPDETDVGIHFAVPVIPMTGRDIARMITAIGKLEADFGVSAAVTFNLCHDSSVEAVISFEFAKCDESDTENAHHCLRKLVKDAIDMGYHPYRVDIANMDLVLDPEDSFWRAAREIKQALDPNGIIAPGRFNL